MAERVPTATNYRDQVLENLPTISPMATKLMGKLAHTNVDFAEVQDLIEKDTMLCAEVMRTVNSARFSRVAPVNRIQSAVSLLGSNQLRKIALGITVSRFLGRTKSSQRWSQLRFNLHSAGVAVMAELVAVEGRVPNAEAAFVAGLFHDVGKFAIAANLRNEYEVILDLWKSSGKSLLECERDVLGFDHAEVSGMILARWEMPTGLQQAVCHHHQPEALGDEPTLAHAVELSDRFINYLGMTTETCESAAPQCALELCGERLPEAEILGRFEAEYAEFSKFFR